MRYFIALATVGLLALPGHGYAKGCVKGAIVGGVAGHFAGHHGVLGAVAAGCAIGHHEANKADQSGQQDHPDPGDRDNPPHRPD